MAQMEGFDESKLLPPSSLQQATVRRTVAFRWVQIPNQSQEEPHPIGVWFLRMGMEGFDEIKVLPPSSRRQATVHWTVAFNWFKSPIRAKKNHTP